MSLNSFGAKLKSGPFATILFAIVTCAMLVTAFTGLGSYMKSRSQMAQTAPSDQPTLTVNGEPVSAEIFSGQVDQLKEQEAAYGQTPGTSDMSMIRGQAAQQVISHVLEAQLAQAHGLALSSSELALGTEKNILTPLRSKLGLPATASQDDMNAKLSQVTTLTVSDIIASSDIKSDLLAQKYQADLINRSQATEQDVLKYYTQWHTRHILISNKTRPDAQAKSNAEEIIKKLKAGGDFVALAKQYSDDPGTKNKGGDDGFIDQSTGYVPEFKTAAFALKAGEVTPEPVLAPEFGYFIIQAVAIKQNLPKDYLKNHAQYVTQVSQAAAQQLGQSELTAAQAKAVIKVNDPRLKGDMALGDASQKYASDPARRGAALAEALNDYDQALKASSSDFSAVAEIHAAKAQVFLALNEPDQELAELNEATKNSEDPQLNMQIGDVYKTKGDVKNALAQYQLASSHAYDNASVHYQLQQDFTQLKQPVLLAQEKTWIADYTKRQASSPSPGAMQ